MTIAQAIDGGLVAPGSIVRIAAFLPAAWLVVEDGDHPLERGRWVHLDTGEVSHWSKVISTGIAKGGHYCSVLFKGSDIIYRLYEEA